MEEDAERSTMFGNSEESQHPDGLPPRVSETTDRTVTMETTERQVGYHGNNREGSVAMETTERQVSYYGNSSIRSRFLCSQFVFWMM